MSASRPGSSLVRVFRIACIWLVVFVAVTAFALNKTYNGFSNVWSSPSAWSDSVGAVAGDSLTFPSTATGITVLTTNDLPASTSFGPIAVTATGSNYQFLGNSISMQNSITSAASTRSHLWAIPLSVDAPALTFEMSGTMGAPVSLPSDNLNIRPGINGALTVTAAITGNGGVTVDASTPAAPVIVTSTNTYLGGTTVLPGAVFQLDGSICCINTTQFTGKFSGIGTAGITDLQSGAFLSPGQSGGTLPGTLNLGNLTMGGIYEVQLQSTTPGGWDMLSVNGSVNLSGDLMITQLSPSITAGTAFRIIDNLGAGAVIGQFTGIADDTPFNVNDNIFMVNYNAGDGNDVDLIVVAPAKHWVAIMSNNWSLPSNWLENVPPSPGDRLIFTSAAGMRNMLNDLAPANYHSFKFEAPGYTINGNQVGLSDGITTAGDPLTINVTIILAGPQTFNFNGIITSAVVLNINGQVFTLFASNGDIVVDGQLSGGGASVVSINGDGFSKVVINGIQSAYSGVMGVGNNGILDVEGTIGPFSLNNVATGYIGGTGTVLGQFNVTNNGMFSPAPGAAIGAPGIFRVGTLPSPSGFDLSAFYNVDLVSSTTPGSGYDQVQVIGNVSIGPAGTIQGSEFFSPPVGAVFTVIDNDGADPISGTLAGQPEGSSLPIGAHFYRVSYIGGDGNDLTLTRNSAPTIANVVPPNGPTSGGTTVTLTGTEFLPGATVTIAGIPATSVTVLSPTTLTFVTPIGGSGPSTILLTNLDGGSAFGVFTYDSPSITSIAPTSGPVGTVVTINGASLNSVNSVTFNGIAASFTLISGTQMEATVPAGVPFGPVPLVVSSNGFTSNVVSFTVVCPTITPVVTPSGSTTLCPGGSVTLSAPAGFSSYLWSPNGETTPSILVTAAGSYSVLVTDAAGCSGSSTPTNVVVQPAPAPTISASGPTDFCAGGSVTLTANVPPTPAVASYFWSPTGETTPSIAATNSGSYTVTVTYTNGCAATSAPQAVNVKPLPTVSISGPTSSCTNTTVTLTASGTGIVSYLWSPGGQNTPSITVPVTAGATASYSVTVTSVDGCTATATHTISPASPRTIAITAPASVTSGATASASAESGFSGPFTWTVLNGTLVSGQGSDTIQFTAGPAGSVTLFVSSPDGACSADGSAVVPIISCSTTGPALITPADNATLGASVNFSWSPVAGATSYEIYLAQGTNAPSLLGVTSATAFTSTVSSGTSTWFVVARLAQSCSPNAVQSATRTFTVTPSTNCPTAAPVALSPASGARVFSPVTFTWSPATGAAGYRVLFSSNGGGFEDAGGQLSATTTSIVVPVPAGSVSWYVEAIYGGCPSIASQRVTFDVDTEDCSKHVAPSLLAPANGSTVASSTVTFSWTSVEGADGYRVWNAVNGAEASTIGETPETMFVATVQPGSIQWFVEALFEGCQSTFSVTRTFNVPQAANCSGNQAPQLISPAAGEVTTAGEVTFSWSSVGALEYELYLSVNSGTPALLTKTAATSFKTEVPEGELEYSVRALFNGCPATMSESRRFRYAPLQNCTGDRPILISPPSDTTPIPSPVKLRWSAVGGASAYRVTVAAPDGVHVFNTTATELPVPVASGAASWVVEALFPGCPDTRSATSEFFVVATPSGCVDLTQPLIAAPSQISDNVSYFVQWQPVVGATSYQLQRSTTGGFDGVAPIGLEDTQASFTDRNSGTDPLTVFYRVRAVSTRCTPIATSAYSSVIGVTILPAVQASTVTEGSALVAQAQTINYSILLGPELAGASFTATPTQPWLTVVPSTGTVPAAGIQLAVTADTEVLPIGSSAGNVILTLVTPDNVTKTGLRQAATGTTTKSVPVNVNLVTPVTPNPKSAPPPDALIIPAIAHADGFNSQFQSDIRITNTSPQIVKYQLTFTPTGDAGISNGRQTTIDIEPGRTIAMDDILKTWFGTGTASVLGSLEIRPLTKTANATSSAAVRGLPNFVTFAASRTFNRTPAGTFGQFIPAVPFANFVGRSSDPSRATILSLQQIAQSPAYRTNLGLVEGSGQPASLVVSVFGDTGQKLTDFDVNLSGGQHLQLGSFLAQRGLQVNDGRIEVRVTSPGGKVTAYASVLDNKTSDSLLVTPVQLAEAGNTKFVLPGVAELSGGIPWQTDMRLFNAGNNPVRAALTFYSLNGSPVQTVSVDLAPKEVRQLDRVLSRLFAVTNDGGALHITTATSANLIATARTYRPDGTGGSFGQFISAVTPNESVALGNRPLQILQVEESVAFRSNIGIAEVTGAPATVEVTIIPPDSKVSSTIRVPMAANQVRQFNALLRQAGLTETHNARVSVRVVEGQGRVTAYASVVDNVTADPTFVPAQ